MIPPERTPTDDADDGGNIDLSRYWAIALKHWRLIALCVGIALAAGFIINAMAPVFFRATSVVSVEREMLNPTDVGVNAPSYFYYYYNPEFLPTQLRLLKSREILQKVAERLGMGRGESLTQAAIGLQGGVDVRQVPNTNLIEITFVGRDAKQTADVVNALADAYIDWNLEWRVKVVGQAAQFIGAQLEQLKVEILEKEKKLLAYGKSKDIISLDPGSNVTMQKLDAISREYTAAMTDRVNKETRFQELQNARPEAIADPLSGGSIATARADLQKLERDYAEKLNLYKPEWPAMLEMKARIQRLKQMLEQTVQETVTRARETARNEYLAAQRREESLKEALNQQKGETLTLNVNAVEYNNLKVEVSTKRSFLDTLLKRQSETDISSRLRDTGMPNIRVVERALVPRPFRVAPHVIFSKYLTIGLVGAFLLCALLEFMDRSVKTLEQVESFLKLPPLGIIPTVGAARRGYGAYGSGGYGYGSLYGYYSRYARRRSKSSSGDGTSAPAVQPEKVAIELLPVLHPRSTVAEAYRALRTALLLSRAGGLKTMAITSGFPGEGKTSTACNVAVVLGQLGKKVLLVDADLHKPRVHEVFKLSNRVGLVSILAESVDPARATQPTSVPGVSIVTAGPMSPNPSELLSSQAMDRFLEQSRSLYDYVVIDSAPVQAVSDAIIIGVKVDGVVLCVKGGKTPREHVARVRDRLLRSNVRILGVLLNNIVEDPTAYGYRYYSYYSKDAKGYTEELPDSPKAQAGSR